MRVFTAGPRTLSELCPEIRQEIDHIIGHKDTIMVGDSVGIDRAIQDHCREKRYRNVKIFAANGQARNNVGHWEVVDVKTDCRLKGFAYYAAKDRAMAEEADWGLMIWNGRSKGTLNDIMHLTSLNKQALVFYTPDQKFHTLGSITEVEKFLSNNEDSSVHEFFLQQRDSSGEERNLYLP